MAKHGDTDKGMVWMCMFYDILATNLWALKTFKDKTDNFQHVWLGLSWFLITYLFLSVNHAWPKLLNLPLLWHMPPFPSCFLYLTFFSYPIAPSLFSSSSSLCFALVRITMFCHLQDCNVLPSSGLKYFVKFNSRHVLPKYGLHYLA